MIHIHMQYKQCLKEINKKKTDRFVLYKGRQKAPGLMVNLLTNGGSKYDRKKQNKNKK